MLCFALYLWNFFRIINHAFVFKLELCLPMLAVEIILVFVLPLKTNHFQKVKELKMCKDGANDICDILVCKYGTKKLMYDCKK